MITRLYPNAKGDLQEVCLSEAEWEALSQDDLDGILGYKKQAEAAPVEAAPAPAPKTAKGKKK